MTTINWYLQFGADAPGPSVEYSYFMPFVLPYANGCPDLTAEFHVRQAAIEFFQRSLAWRQDLDAAMTVDQVAGSWAPYLTMAEGIKIAAQSFSADMSRLSCCAS